MILMCFLSSLFQSYLESYPNSDRMECRPWRLGLNPPHTDEYVTPSEVYTVNVVYTFEIPRVLHRP